jgi:hypothetical protein
MIGGLIGNNEMFAFSSFVPTDWVAPAAGQPPPLVEIGMLNGALFEEATGPLVGFDAAQVGTWTVTETVTPLPAALPLFATGIGGLGFLGWRRKRKAQAVA